MWTEGVQGFDTLPYVYEIDEVFYWLYTHTHIYIYTYGIAYACWIMYVHTCIYNLLLIYFTNQCI